jgi:hypothetical protein
MFDLAGKVALVTGAGSPRRSCIFAECLERASYEIPVMVDRLESGLEVIKRKENKRTAWQSWPVVSRTDLRHGHEPCLRQR